MFKIRYVRGSAQEKHLREWHVNAWKAQENLFNPR